MNFIENNLNAWANKLIRNFCNLNVKKYFYKKLLRNLKNSLKKREKFIFVYQILTNDKNFQLNFKFYFSFVN